MLLILWLNEHRRSVIFAVAAMLWFGAYGYYFRRTLRGYFTKGQPHSWSVDMVTKKAVARGQEEVR